jgi:uncharacterized protein YgbK (DUF1537 family)
LIELDCFLIADDLTGACDAAVQFGTRGYRTRVCISADADGADANVIAVTTESRDCSVEDARARLAEAASRLARRSVRILFKKIDSTLRGNLGQEIVAAMELFECDVAVLCPAFPALNRVVEEGRLLVGGENFEPVDVVALLRKHGLEKSVHLRPVAIRGAISAGAHALCLDAASDQDLDQIAAEALAMDGRILWVGSGGLAAALARTLPAQTATGRAALAEGPVLFCIGSDHAVTAGQQETLIANRSVRMLPWEQASRERIAEALDRGQHVCLRIPRDQTHCDKIRELIRGAPAAVVFVSGGDTASLVCQAMEVRYIDLYHEIVPGIPYGIFGGGGFDGIAVATKSGGFGSVNALIQVADYFLCPNQ